MNNLWSFLKRDSNAGSFSYLLKLDFITLTFRICALALRREIEEKGKLGKKLYVMEMCNWTKMIMTSREKS